MKLRSLLAGVVLLASTLCVPAQQPPRGFSTCTGNPPAALSVSNVSSNVKLSTCGPSVLLLNIGTTEAFWATGSASTTAATTSSNSIPAGSYQLLIVPTDGWYLAAITSSSTTTLRILQGYAQ